PAALRFRRVAVRDAATAATADFAVGDLLTMQVTSRPVVTFLRGKPLLLRSPAEMRQAGLEAGLAAGPVQALLGRGGPTGVVGPGFYRAEHPGAYDEADVRLVSDLAERAAVHIDNARLYTSERDAAVTLQRSLLPRDIPPVAGLEVAYRYQPASAAAEIGGD